MPKAIDIRDQLKTLLENLSGFGGAGDVTTGKRDVFEQPGASVYVAKMENDRQTMASNSDAQVERFQQFVVVLQDDHATDAELHLLTLAEQFESDVEDALEAWSFPTGVHIGLDSQQTTVSPDTPLEGVLTQIYEAVWTAGI